MGKRAVPNVDKNKRPSEERKLSLLLSLVSPIQFMLGIIVAFVAGALFLWAFRENAIRAYEVLFEGAFGSKRYIGETLVSTTPLIFTGLSVALGFHCGLFNMGVEGQLEFGAMVAAYIGYAWAMPKVIHLPLALLGGAIVGGIWGAIPGYLKAYHKIHEVITTIMLNYIAYAVADYAVAVGGPMKGNSVLPASPKIMATARLDRLWPGTRVSAGIIVALLTAVLVWFFVFRTRIGYKMRAVGFNADAAEYAGINPKDMTVWAMALSGALGGMAGAVEVLGIHYRFFASFSPGYGWDGIAVALLGLLHPVGVVAAAFLLGMLRSGSITLQAIAGISKEVISILTALVIFFSATNQTLRPILERAIRKHSVREEASSIQGREDG